MSHLKIYLGNARKAFVKKIKISIICEKRGLRNFQILSKLKIHETIIFYYLVLEKHCLLFRFIITDRHYYPQ